MARQSQSMFDLVAEEISEWIDHMSDEIAEAVAAGGKAPFSAQLTEAQKIDYYAAQYFNPDGTPNVQGRAAQMARLGPEGFAQVYKAVVKAHPNLAIPSPPPGAAIQPAPFPGAEPRAPNLPGLPASLGIPRTSGGQQLGESALSSVTPGAGEGPLG
jgi:hypothetical protein